MVFQNGNIPWNKGKGEYLPREVRERINEINRERIPWWVERGVENPSKTDEVKRKLRKISKKGNKNSMFGKHHTDDARIKIGKSTEKRFKDPEFRKRFFNGVLNAWKDQKLRDKVGKISSERWQNPEFIRKVMKSRCAKPNKQELMVDSLIRIFYNDYPYNGDYSQGVSIGGKIPDWINVNGQKKVIELFGRTFHDPNISFFEISLKRTYEETIKHYKKYGFKCLIIWSDELKERGKLLEKICEFVEG